MDGSDYRGWRLENERDTRAADRAALRTGVVMAAALLAGTVLLVLAVAAFGVPPPDPAAFWAAGSLG